MRAREILETCLYAADLHAAEAFYTRVLGMEVFARVEGRHVFFRCGGRVFLVFDPRRTRAGGELPAHGPTGAGHVCFAARAEEMDGWRAHLRAHGVAIEHEHHWPGGGASLYVRDPAGNSVEVGTPAIWRLDDASVFGAADPAS